MAIGLKRLEASGLGQRKFYIKPISVFQCSVQIDKEVNDPQKKVFSSKATYRPMFYTDDILVHRPIIICVSGIN